LQILTDPIEQFNHMVRMVEIPIHACYSKVAGISCSFDKLITSWKEDEMAVSTLPAESRSRKRPIIAGLLSASPLTILFLLQFLPIQLPKQIENMFEAALYGFLLPAFPGILLSFINAFLGILVVILIWFGIGALLARLIRKNSIVILCWVTILGLSIWITRGECFYCF
jgi:hypothetical protein